MPASGCRMLRSSSGAAPCAPGPESGEVRHDNLDRTITHVVPSGPAPARLQWRRGDQSQKPGFASTGAVRECQVVKYAAYERRPPASGGWPGRGDVDTRLLRMWTVTLADSARIGSDSQGLASGALVPASFARRELRASCPSLVQGTELAEFPGRGLDPGTLPTRDPQRISKGGLSCARY